MRYSLQKLPVPNSACYSLHMKPRFHIKLSFHDKATYGYFRKFSFLGLKAFESNCS